MGDYAEAMVSQMGFGRMSRGRIVTSLKCPCCDMVFGETNDRRKHMRKLHSVEFKKGKVCPLPDMPKKEGE